VSLDRRGSPINTPPRWQNPFAQCPGGRSFFLLKFLPAPIIENKTSKTMTKVPPGDKTGIYYVIIAGLPWQCSWQKLKDFARNQQPDGSWIEVDHAMVYPDTTNGWVRVKGKSEFLKVLGMSSSICKDVMLI
jgi:hypothetical protein